MFPSPYVAASRGKTFGRPTTEQPFPKDSAIYWNGQMSSERVKRVKLKQNSDVCVLVQRRDAWVDHLYDRAAETKARCNDEWKRQAGRRVRKAIDGEPVGRHNLDLKIIQTLLHPNETWKERREAYMVPSGFFNN